SISYSRPNCFFVGTARECLLLRASRSFRAFCCFSVCACNLRQYRVKVEGGGFLTRWERCKVRDLLRYQILHLVHHIDVLDLPLPIVIGIDVGPFERITTQVVYLRHSKFYKWLHPDPRRICALLCKDNLVVSVS